MGDDLKEELRDITRQLAEYLKNLDVDDMIFMEDKSSGRNVVAGWTGLSKIYCGHNSVNKSCSAKKETLMESLRTEIENCRKCKLGLSRIKSVFGIGNLSARVMFVGEGPGYEEDHRGEPFVGKAGELLDDILKAIKLSRQMVYISNIVKCHPMINPETPQSRGNDRPPSPDEMSACKPYLDRQIALIKPMCVVALGSVAAKILLGTDRTIGSVRGKWYDYPVELFNEGDGVKVLPTYHPAALLRNPSLKRQTWEDMKMLKSFLEKIDKHNY